MPFVLHSVKQAMTFWITIFLSVCLWNARSLCNKFSFFQAFVYSRSLDCVCITESWFSNHIFNNEVLPSNYSIYRCDRKSRGGGVMVAIRDSISSRQISANSEAEMVIVELDIEPPLIVCCVLPSSSL